MSESLPRPTARRVPAYFDYLIDAYHAGARCRWVHLGWWDADDSLEVLRSVGFEAFQAAQDRLDQLIVDWAMLTDHQAVLDVGCGFGGTLDRVNRGWHSMQLVGVNIDARQLAICGEVLPRNDNQLSWVLADACCLPFPDESFDRVVSVEAMFHFSSRREFFAEIARVLRPGGVAVMSDIVAVRTALGDDHTAHAVELALRDGYGPWPDLWGLDADHRGLAQHAGLTDFECLEGSDATRPSHRFTVPATCDRLDAIADPTLRAAWSLRFLHEHQALRYPVMRLRRPVR